MRRRAKRVLLYATGLLLALPVAAVVLLAGLDPDSHRERIAAELAGLTGRDVSLDGPLSLQLSWAPTLRVQGLRLANAGWGSAPHMLEVPQLTLQLHLPALLTGHLAFRSVLLSDAALLLERSAEGVLNWQLDGAAAAVAPASAPPAVALDRLRVERLTLRYRDATGVDIELSLDELTVVAPSMDGPLVLAARGRLVDAPVTVSASLSTLAALLGGRRAKLEALVELADMRLRAAGAVPAAGEHGAARVSLEAPEAASLLVVARRLLPALEGLHLPALSPLRLSGEVAGRDAAVSVTDLRLEAGDSRLRGDGVFSWRDRPRIDARLGGTLMDLSALSTAAAARDRVFAEQPLPWSALERLDAALEVELERLRIGGLEFAPVTGRLSLERGSLRLLPELGLAGGRLHGELRLDAAGRRLHAALRASEVALGEVLAGLGAGAGVSGAPAALDLRLASRGESPHELVAAAEGGVLLQVGAGRLPAGALGWLGGDLALTLVRSLGLGGGDMRLECGVANFALTRGVLSRENGIGVRFDRMNLVGGGSIDLGRERLDLRLAPQTREGVGLSPGSTLAGMVALRGSLTEPTVEVSGEGLAKAGAKVGAAVVTGGLSLLASALYERLTAESDVCAAARGAGG